MTSPAAHVTASPVTLLDCPACARPEPDVAATLDDADKRERFRAFDERKYGGLMRDWLEALEPVVLRCRTCGHCWYRTQPAPSRLARLYERSRPLSAAPVAHEPTPAMLAEMQRLRRMTRPATGRPSLLDYGSGFGRWALAAVHAGFEVTAFEPSAARGERRDAPFRIVHELAALSDAKFDAIQLEQVLEHVSDPYATLHGLMRLCADHTVIRVTVPNILRAPEGEDIWKSWPFDGRSPHTLAPFEHLHGFTPRSLREVCERAGFRPQWTLRTWRHDPARQLRRVLAPVIGRLGTTSFMLRRGAA